MPAPTLVAIQDGPTKTPNERERALSRARYQSWETLQAYLRQNGLNVRNNDDSAFAAAWEADFKLQSYWEHRAVRAERQLRMTLATDALDDDQRATILTGMYGKGASRRDPTIYSDAEARMVAQYRSMAPADRQAVRRVFERMAGITEKP